MRCNNNSLSLIDSCVTLLMTHLIEIEMYESFKVCDQLPSQEKSNFKPESYLTVLEYTIGSKPPRN